MSIYIKNNLIFLSILFFILPFLFLTGPLLVEIFLILLFVSFLTLSRNNLELIKENIFKIYFFIFLCLFLLISSLNSSHVLLSLESTLFYFRYGIFVLSIYFFLNNNQKLENSFFFGLLFSLLFVLINSDLQIYFGRDLFGNIYDGTRLSSIFGDELILGDYFINFLPILISLFVAYFNKNLFYNILFLLILINSVFLIFYSGERIAVFYAVIYLIFLCIFFPIKKKLLNIFLFILIIFSIIFIYLNQNIKERLVNQTIRDLKITLNGENTQETNLFIFSQQHQYYYETALNIFNGSNKLIGSGPKTYRELCKEEKFKSFYDNNIVCSTSPHNYYIQALSETGIIGIIILTSAFIYFLMQLFRFKTNDNILNFKYKSVIFVILTNIFPFMPSGSLFNNYYSLILYFNFSLFIYYKSKL